MNLVQPYCDVHFLLSFSDYVYCSKYPQHILKVQLLSSLYIHDIISFHRSITSSLEEQFVGFFYVQFLSIAERV